MPNRNTVITNWLGHGQFGKAPHMIEVTRDNPQAEASPTPPAEAGTTNP